MFYIRCGSARVSKVEWRPAMEFQVSSAQLFGTAVEVVFVATPFRACHSPHMRMCWVAFVVSDGLQVSWIYCLFPSRFSLALGLSRTFLGA